MNAGLIIYIVNVVVIFKGGMEMFKILIVDDERHIRNGIISIIDWNSMECEVIKDCANGLEAVEYLKSSEVDIVICDIKMPGMNGLEVAEYVKLNIPKTKVILLTAYSDFNNAQLAIKHNVSEYVVKTEFIDELPSAIEKVKKAIIEQREKENNVEVLRMILNEKQQDLKYKFFTELAEDMLTDKEEIKEKLQEYKLHNKSYCVINYETTLLTSFFSSEYNHEYRDIKVINNFINMVFKDYEYNIVKMHRNLGMIILYWNDTNLQVSKVEILLKDVNNMVNQFTNYSIKFSISDKHEGVENLSKAYKEALLALSKVYSSNAKFYLNTYKKQDDILTNNSESVEDLKSLMNYGSLEEIEKSLVNIFKSFSNSSLSLEQVKTKMILLFSASLAAFENYNIVQHNLKEQETIIYQKINESKSLQSIFEVSLFIAEHILDISKNNESSKSLIVREANKYIRENYNKNISLNTIAGYLHVNNSYLSRLYKKETGDTLVEALNRYRIEIAKKLLKRPSSKIFEVGIEVGIEDPAYFTHVFTKYCGCSPKEYKSK